MVHVAELLQAGNTPLDAVAKYKLYELAAVNVGPTLPEAKVRLTPYCDTTDCAVAPGWFTFAKRTLFGSRYAGLVLVETPLPTKSLGSSLRSIRICARFDSRDWLSAVVSSEVGRRISS